MHASAFQNCEKFANNYDIGDTVLDVGSYDVNGTTRPIFEDMGVSYTGLDIEDGRNVDVVIAPGDPLPFGNNRFDTVVSTSCLEHDPAFWITFAEMVRVSAGLVYVCVPSIQKYHAYPVDCWRFMLDSMPALATWTGAKLLEHYVDPRPPCGDCVGVFRVPCLPAK